MYRSEFGHPRTSLQARTLYDLNIHLNSLIIPRPHARPIAKSLFQIKLNFLNPLSTLMERYRLQRLQFLHVANYE